MIYINQSENFTILGGAIWIYQGEQWTQACVTSLKPSTNGNQIATFEVEQGYDVSIWKTASPRNQGCVDDFDPSHYRRPDCTFRKVQEYSFESLASSHTLTATVLES